MRTARRNVDALSFVAISALARIELLPLNDQILSTAAYLDPPSLRTLDALHVATALTLGEELVAVVTYDVRMQEAAAALGMPVAAPA
jgi:uncharacterized protein